MKKPVAPKCICPDRPSCVYPHLYLLGVPQEKSDRTERNATPESRNQYLVNIASLPKILPMEYFRTTGDLHSKLVALQKDVNALLSGVYKLLHVCKTTQGKSEFMETQITEDGRILAVPKTTKAERARRCGQVRLTGRDLQGME